MSVKKARKSEKMGPMCGAKTFETNETHTYTETLTKDDDGQLSVNPVVKKGKIYRTITLLYAMNQRRSTRMQQDSDHK